MELVVLKEITHGVDIENALARTLTHSDVPRNKLVNVATVMST